MGWNEITTAEIAPRQPLDAELFAKIRNNLNITISALGLPHVIPNGSFEQSTGVLPELWDITTFKDGSASISTGAHGSQSLKLTHTGSSAGGAEAWSQDYLAAASSNITIHGILWATGATATAIVGGISVRTYDSAKTIISTVSTVHSSYTVNPTTIAMTMSFTTNNVRFIKIGCILGSASTVAGSIYFDGLYIQNT